MVSTVHDKPTRKRILTMDNAPYHKGAPAQFWLKTKGQIADMLRQKGITRITIPRTGAASSDDETEDIYDVPAAGAKWAIGKPTAAELREAVVALLRKQDPQSVEAPWLDIMRRINRENAWGPGDGHGFSCVWCCPYTSTWVPIELRWADGKNYVANPVNRKGNEPKSLAVATRQLRERWYSEKTTGASLFRHCEKEMNDYIASDIADECDSPFTCDMSDLDKFVASVTDEKLAQMIVACGMADDGLDVETNDTFDGGMDGDVVDDSA